MMDPSPRQQAKIVELERRLAEAPSSLLFLPLAEAYRAAGRLWDAEHTLRQGLEGHPDYHAARACLGRVVMEAGRPGEAEHALEKVLEAAPDNLLARQLLDTLASRRRAEAEPPAAGAPDGRRSGSPTHETWDAAPSPADELSTVTLAELYLQQGDRERALAIYREVVRREPDNEEWGERVRWLEGGGPFPGLPAPGPAPAPSARRGGPQTAETWRRRRTERRLRALRAYLDRVHRSSGGGSTRTTPDLV